MLRLFVWRRVLVDKRVSLIVLVSVLVLFSFFDLSCSSGSRANGGGNSGAVTFTMPVTSATIDQGQTVGLFVSVADSSNQGVTWSLQGAFGTTKQTPIGTLSGETATTATYNACAAPLACSPNQQVTVTATSVANPANSASIAIFVNPPPAVTVQTPFTSCPPSGQQPSGSVATVNSFFVYPRFSPAISVSGGVAPYTWTISSGALPSGLSTAEFSPPNTGSLQISGTPTSAGCSGAITFQVTDATGASSTATAPLYLVVLPPALGATVPNYPNLYVNANDTAGIPYPPVALQFSNGTPPYTFCISNPWNGLQSNPPLSAMAGGLCSAPQTSPSLTIYGTPNPNDYCTGGGCPPGPSVTVTDGQTPYPASVVASLSSATALQYTTPACDPTAVSPVTYLQASTPYAFLLHGFDANGPVVISGSIATQSSAAANGSQGLIVGGSEDIVRTTGSQAGLTIVGGSYYTNQNRGCMTLVNSAGTSTTFDFTLGGCPVAAGTQACQTSTQPADANTICGQGASGATTVYSVCFTTGRVIEFDDSTGSGTHVSGILRQQNPSAFSSGLSGLYAFGLSGWDSTGGRYASAGSFSASSGALSALAADINDAGTLQSALTGGSGTLGAIDSNGRATATLTIGTAPLNLVVYVVNNQEIMAATTGIPSPANPVASGEAISTTGPFGNASLFNTHMFHIGGESSTGPDVSVGIFTFDGQGAVGGTIYEDAAGTLGTTQASGIYSVDSSTGRVALSAPQVGQTLGAHLLVGYVIPAPGTLTRLNCLQPASCVTGFLLGTDATAQAGILEFQTSAVPPPPPFYNNFVAGYYAFGTDEPIDSLTPTLDGFANAAPTAGSTTSGKFGSPVALSQDVDYSDVNYCNIAGLQQTCQLLFTDLLNSGSGYVVNSNGTGTFGGGTVSVTNGNVVFYIDESPLNGHPAVVVAEQ
jgi:hypothetical protein